ncbi:PPE domain-containing protein [Nocardia aurantia]|uniref:PPE domain-containing protein n=1 Tax=Nocardia aurantia TaxID=2585199 RepID=A0A7K0DR48_9NOCA|nr:PPE domain-containing protein [Nocardia aurantia]MQY28219.1 hypothetical protein [Nocardia aurantia]
MPELNVDPQELLGLASTLAGTAHTTGQSLPAGWVQHAGADPVSAAAVPFLNGQTESIFNGTLDTLNGIHQTAYKIGSSAVGYTAADVEGGQRIADAGGGAIGVNPVSAQPPHDFRLAPPGGPGGGAVDPMTFAQQLHTGPGIGPATAFSGSIRDYLSTTHAGTVGQLDGVANTLQNWSTGGPLAATEVSQHRNTLDRYGSHLSGLADNIDSYTDAFSTAKSKHPTPQEIAAARKELLAAMKGKDKARLAKALARYQEVMAQSQEAFTEYTSTVGEKLGSGTGTGTGSTPTSGTGTGTGGTSSSGSSSDASSLMQMLSSLMSSMGQGANGLTGQNAQSADALGESGLDGYGYPSIPGSLDGGGGGGSGYGSGGGGNGLDTVNVGAMPMVASTAGLNTQVASTAARAAVSEPISAATAATARGGAAAGGGMPYMPMMPMGGMGGAGGGSGNDRNRVVAWHPDRLMYVDDTPYTEQVIGEKPTIAPTATPPTTPGIGNQTQSGGSA